MKVTTRLSIVLAISLAFFCVEIAIGFRTKSLALVADAFHYLNDIVAYIIAFLASYLKNSGRRPPGFTYAFHRAEIVGSFFNGVFLIALALSIFLQSIERFISIERVKDPLWVVIVGAIGLCLNLLSALIIHEHGHHHGSSEDVVHAASAVNLELTAIDSRSARDAIRDLRPVAIEEEDIHALHNHVRLPPPVGTKTNLGTLGVFVHILGDAINNIGVIVAGLIILKVASPDRFYADPAISLAISVMIFGSAIPLTAKSGRILLEAAPSHLDLTKITEDLLTVCILFTTCIFGTFRKATSCVLSMFLFLQRPPLENGRKLKGALGTAWLHTVFLMSLLVPRFLRAEDTILGRILNQAAMNSSLVP